MVTDDNSLKQLLQSLVKTDTQIYEGVVRTESPLSIKITGVNNVVLTEQSLIIPKEMREHTINVEIDSEKKKVKCSGLKKSEEIYLLTVNNSNQFFILGRKE